MSASSARDADGDEFMSTTAAASEPVNKFARPASVASVDSDIFAFHKGGSATEQSKNFTKQYAALYFTRLTALKKVVLEAAAQALPSYPQCAHPVTAAPPKLCTRILDMPQGEFSVVAGTLYKEMKLKPCILDEYARTAQGATSITQAGQVYTSPDDSLVLEDEFGRVQLTCAPGSPDTLPIARLVSGLVVSVLGREVAGGKFEVHALFLPEMAPQKSLPPPPASSRPPAYMLCVSGLQLGAPGQDPTPVQLLMDYVTGLLGSTAEQRASASIVRVLVAGNSLHRFDKRGKGTGMRIGGEDNEGDEAVAPLRELDVLLTQLAAAVPVDILPGETDPSNFTLPQQPFHKCLFPSASTYSTFGRTTNPAWLRLDGGVETLVTAGQNVDDLAKYAEAKDNIEFLEGSLRWRCVAPTAPDTLGCYPYQTKDPFVLTESPHLYIVGNQSAYRTRVVRGAQGQQVRAVCVPHFATTGQAVLIDLHSPTFDTSVMTFKVAK